VFDGAFSEFRFLVQVEKAKESQRTDFPDGIPECGADALRFGLLAYTTQGRDINLDIKRLVGYRQFCNKLWNAVKFGLTYLTNFEPTHNMHLEIIGSPHVSPRDTFILSRLNSVIADCNQYLKDYNFGAVASALHSFFLYDVSLWFYVRGRVICTYHLFLWFSSAIYIWKLLNR
jgi:valyl-tRNA synthetase